MTLNGNNCFPWLRAKPLRAGLSARILPPYDIYEPKSQKSRRIFKFLQFRTKRTVFRESSTSFAIERRLSLYDIYELKSQISRRYFIFLQDRTKRAICREFSRKFDKLRYFSLVPRPPMNIFFIGTTYTNDDIFHWYHVHQ
jgi:hypothetical protein